MFALEIEFHDGISSPETILVRRTSSVVGSSEQAHVVIEGIASSSCELRLVRGIGREFRCQPVRRVGQESAPLPFLEGSYRGNAELRLGDVTVRVTALDLDLCLNNEEAPDTATVRVLNRAMSGTSPLFPAIAVHGSNPVFLSFPSDQPLLIGRSRKCGLRLDASDVSSEHARVGIDDGRMWVEDLGSTNGTFVGGQRVSGRRHLDRQEKIQIGSEFSLSPVLNAQDVAAVGGQEKPSESERSSAEATYPCVVSTSELVRPNRFALSGKGELRMGRDPANDIWINAPHVSRQHLTIEWSSPEDVTLIDTSSNGTFIWGERLRKDVPTKVPDGLTILDFCSGITAAICLSAADERSFLNKADPKSVERGREESFKSEEVALSSYRGAQTGAKLQNWSEFADSTERTEEKPPSIFERLAQRQGNQVQADEPRSHGEEPDNDTWIDDEAVHDDADELHEEPAAERMYSSGGGETMTLSAIREDAEEHSELGHQLGGELVGEQDGYSEEAADLLVPEGYDIEEFQPPVGNGILKVILVGALCVLLLFCLVLVFGFFSDNLFY